MESYKIINFLDNMPNEPSKFKIRNKVEINDDARGTYITNSPIKFQMSKNSSLRDYNGKWNYNSPRSRQVDEMTAYK